MPESKEPTLSPPTNDDELWRVARELVSLIVAVGHEGEHISEIRSQHIHAPSGFRIDIRQREGAFKVELVSEDWLRRGLR